ncbi:MAG TPA: hypothetical protein VHM25_27545 [Polyangiaceae bacterium]|nr:hypothetical protein [Polyangiaceae bacterium]
MVIRNFHGYPSLLLLAAGVACQHAAVAPSSPHTKTAAVVAHAATAPVTTLASPSPAATAATADPSPFVEVVPLGYGARLDVAGQRAFLSTEKLLLSVYDDRVRIEPELLEGLQLGRSAFPRVFGSMPESGWAVQTSYAERTTRSSLSRWTGSEWVNADNLLRDKNVIGISAWGSGRTLALVTSEYDRQFGFVQLGGTRGALPQLPHTARNDYACMHGLQPEAMTALASGEVYLTGTRCSVIGDEVTTHGVIIHSWAPGQTRAKTTVLPGLSEKEASSGEITGIVAASSSNIFVSGFRTTQLATDDQEKDHAYVAHFDGKDWRTFSAPPTERIEELQRAPNGKLWALASGELWSTIGVASESAAWQHIALPQATKDAGENPVSSFWVQDDEQVWATIGSDVLSYLVRTKASATPLSVPSNEQVAELSRALDPTAAYECESPTLVLVALSRQAPKDADMPSVRKALHSHAELADKVQFVELPFLTRRYLAARGDTDSLLATQEILTNARIPGVAPEMRCLNEAPTRTLTVDFGAPKPDLPAGKPTRPSKPPSKRPLADLSY